MVFTLKLISVKILKNGFLYLKQFHFKFYSTNLNEYYVPYGKEFVYGFVKLSKNIKIFTMSNLSIS